MAEAAVNRRRRRILDQGSDRLAFITGRIQALPNPVSVSSSQSQPHDPNTTTLPTTVNDSDSISQNREPYNAAALNTITQTPPKHEGENEILTVSEPEPEPESEPEPEPELVRLQPPPPPRTELPKRFIIPSDITRAINSSRVTRLCCSILVAVLVILAYSSFGFLGTKFFNTALTYRPLYLVLVTNVTVVIARLFSSKQRRDNRGSSGGDGDGGGEYAQLARTLELCVVAKNVADAVFMDCAVYAVVLSPSNKLSTKFQNLIDMKFQTSLQHIPPPSTPKFQRWVLQPLLD